MTLLGWVMSCFESNCTSCWRKRWKVPLTCRSNATTMKSSRSRSTKLQPKPVTRLEGNPPTKDKVFLVLSLNSLKPSRWESISLYWGSSSTKFSMPSRTRRGQSPWSRSNTTLHSSERKSIVLTTTVKRHKIVHCRSLRKYMEELVLQGFLEEYIP